MGKEQRSHFIFLGVSLFLIVLCARKVNSLFVWRQPPLTEMVVTENYMGDLGFLLLGSRRLAADLAYIQFLQYYGTAFHSEESEEHEKEGHVHLEGDDFPRVKEFGSRMLHLDPFFNAPILEISGALAFNLHQVKEALDLLTEAIRLDPSFYRYRLYAAAILFKNDRQDKELIGLLKQAIQFPDCPVLFQHVLGNLLKKYGDFEGAAKVYLHMHQTAVDEFDRATALRKLDELVGSHPELENFAILPATRR